MIPCLKKMFIDDKSFLFLFERCYAMVKEMGTNLVEEFHV